MYDLIILGAGPGGYIAAERAGQAGLNVLLVEKDQLGGVCLNQGCIPTKTLLHSAKLITHMEKAAEQGLSCKDIKFDLKQAMTHKNNVVSTLRNGISYQMQKNKVQIIKGHGKLVDRSTITVNDKTYTGRNIIIATGSSSLIPPIQGISSSSVLTHKEVLALKQMPEKIVIIGAGFIGMEFASFFSTLGVEVTVIEMLEEILPTIDRQIASTIRQSMPDVHFYLKARANSIKNNSVNITYNQENISLKADFILLAAGRKANITDMGFEQAGLDYSKSGIRVNEQMQTNLPAVYAVGDVTGLSQLAHTASRMAEVAVANILGEKQRMRYHAVPWVIYTLPEAAGCGLTEQQAREQGIEIESLKLPLRFNGRFLAEQGNAPGSCNIIIEKETEKILGVHMVGGLCSELIFAACSWLETELRVKDVKEIIFPHPTLSEILKDTLWQL